MNIISNCINGIASTVGVLISLFFVIKLMRMPKGSGKQLSISNMIKEASFVYLRKQYLVIFLVAIVMAGILYKIFDPIAVGFFGLGVFSSSFSGFFAMFIAVNGNVRTVEGAKKRGLSGAFKAAIFSGASASIFLNSIGILCVIPAIYFGNMLNNLVCLIVGVSLVSIFARLGGGIFTKGADVGADMVGKNQLGLPEDDPRNPAVIADNVGDNVGDTAGMAADLFETYVVSIASCIMIGNNITLPLSICVVGLFSSIIPIFFMRFKQIWKEMGGYFNAATCLFIIAMLAMSKFQIGIQTMSEFVCILTGAICVFGILKITEYYTSCDFQPVKNVAEASKSGDGANAIAGLSYGFLSVTAPIVMVLVSVMLCNYLCGTWGIALGVMGITALSPAILLLDIYGPVSDNAGGIAEMSDCHQDVRIITDELDAVGNTTKAVTKGYAIGSAVFASLIMFYFFKIDLLKLKAISLDINLFSPFVMIGLFTGALLPFIFAGLSMGSVGRAAQAVVEEVRLQIKHNPDILTGKKDPDYKKTVDFLTTFAIKEMVMPSLLPLIAMSLVFCTGYLYNDAAMFTIVASLLLGVTVSGSLLSIFMTISGGLWDNAKKFVEQHGGKGSAQHKAAVTGDTIGDPFKDTCGPALNSFIKLTNIIAVLLIHFSI